ncbi:MAG: polymer-forming cytoskeletal protein [Hydrogenophaga sp.]|nr:polymer-forming cytoskeletal protein [Hydrogenophaga sp.]
MAFFKLFNKQRRPEVFDLITRPDEVLQSGMVFDGGTIFASGALQIDSSMRNVSVVGKATHPICISALGRLLECSISGGDVLVEGDFAGEIEATGDVEITNTAQVRGLIKYGGELHIGLLVDRSALKLQRMTKAAEVVELPQPAADLAETTPTGSREEAV